MKMEKNFKRWVFFFVLLPFSVFLVVLNVASWKLMIRNHKTSLTSVVESVGNDFDALLSTETVRLQNIGLLPNVDSLLASTERVRRNSLPQRRDQIESIRERWPNLQRDD